ncbi:hypothetical protein GOODEAATRI_027611 [Goodea atripinnis]|uniref:Uncharacterized protein n=1 Tax=Goodea atripinnis TaxID=208336 RepID=A0ABV0NS28_9TELE
MSLTAWRGMASAAIRHTSAVDEFQCCVDKTYEGLNSVAALVNDMLVFGKAMQEHDRNLRPCYMVAGRGACG